MSYPRRDLQRFVDRLTRRSVLTAEEQQAILDLPCHAQQVGSNKDFVALGDTVDHASFIVEGFVGRFDQTVEGKRQITAIHIPGDIADLHTLHLAPLDHELSALGPAVVAFMPHRAFRYMLDRSPHLTQAFWRDTFIRLGIMREWVTNLGRRDAIARVAHVVCELAVRLQNVDLAQNLSFSIPWTQTDLADACGISNVHANRVVQELRRHGLMDWDSRKVMIRDWDAVAKIGDFSDEYLQLGRPLEREPLLGAKVSEHV